MPRPKSISKSRIHDISVEEMIEFRENGMSYQKIADYVGVTRQAIHEAIRLHKNKMDNGKRGRRFTYKRIIYKGIYEYFKENKEMSLTVFARQIHGADCNNSAVMKIRNFITGEFESKLTIEQIRSICVVVGKPFEYVFQPVVCDGEPLELKEV